MFFNKITFIIYNYFLFFLLCLCFSDILSRLIVCYESRPLMWNLRHNIWPGKKVVLIKGWIFGIEDIEVKSSLIKDSSIEFLPLD